MPSRSSRPLDLFKGGDQVDNFSRMASILPSRRILRSPTPRPLTEGTRIDLPDAVAGDDGIADVEGFLGETRSTGLLVLRDGAVRLERYWHGYDRRSQHISFSVCKSFVSTLIAFAVRDGFIASLDDPVDRIVPELRGSGYEGVSIRQVLQMSSGVRWNEDYGDPESDIAKFNKALTEDGSFLRVCSGLPREREPGTFNRYSSADTQVLASVVAGTTGLPVWEYMERALWHPLGMEEDAALLVDGEGFEACAMGLNATLRDYAKLGALYADRGRLNARDLLPPGYWDGCATAKEPHLRPGSRPNATSPLGYGYQWWIPDDSGPFSAVGVYHQFIWVDPRSRTVVVKTSARPAYGQDPVADDDVDARHYSLFKAIARSLDG